MTLEHKRGKSISELPIDLTVCFQVTVCEKHESDYVPFISGSILQKAHFTDNNYASLASL